MFRKANKHIPTHNFSVVLLSDFTKKNGKIKIKYPLNPHINPLNTI